MKTHGLVGTYVHGCRCAPCTQANTDYRRAERHRRAERIQEDPTLAPHGRVTTYTNWGCRCAPCSEANAARCREQNKKRSRRRGTL